MSKGSKRRPAQVPEKEIEDRWERTFPRTYPDTVPERPSYEPWEDSEEWDEHLGLDDWP